MERYSIFSDATSQLFLEERMLARWAETLAPAFLPPGRCPGLGEPSGLWPNFLLHLFIRIQFFAADSMRIKKACPSAATPGRSNFGAPHTPWTNPFWSTFFHAA